MQNGHTVGQSADEKFEVVSADSRFEVGRVMWPEHRRVGRPIEEEVMRVYRADGISLASQ